VENNGDRTDNKRNAKEVRDKESKDIQVREKYKQIMRKNVEDTK
jgi:hypothetical protein